jgi:hypothetical protein
MDTYEIIKETKLNGDVILFIEKNGMYIPDSLKVVGNISDNEYELNLKLESKIKAITKVYDNILGGVKREVITSKTI